MGSSKAIRKDTDAGSTALLRVLVSFGVISDLSHLSNIFGLVWIAVRSHLQLEEAGYSLQKYK